MEFHSQDEFGVEVYPTYVRLDAPFAISRDITLPTGGEYDYTRYAVARSDGKPADAGDQRPVRNGRVLFGDAAPDGRGADRARAPGLHPLSQRRVESDRSGRGQVHHAALSRDRRDAVHVRSSPG